MKRNPSVMGLHQLVEAYQEHLQSVAGLAPSTCVDRTYYARQFLEAQRLPGKGWHLRQLTSRAILAHVLELSRLYPPATLQNIGSALRSFLRFLCLSGRCPTDLSAAVPRIGAGPARALQQALSADELQQLLCSFDLKAALGRRDYAVVLCLAKLGLRAREVAGLSLDDLDWRAGAIRLPQTKSRQERLLPMPASVGKGLADYLRCARPPTSLRSVFVSQRDGAALSRNAVGKLSATALRRAGLNGPRHGAHLLRHTMATQLVQAGASLKEVADLLGHRNLNTARGYVKVSSPQLQAVALPWLEVTL